MTAGCKGRKSGTAKDRAARVQGAKNESSLYAVWSLILLLLSVYASVCLSPKTAEYVRRGLQVCAVQVVPSVFPFLILSDLYSKFGYPERILPLSKLFKKIFGIEEVGLRAFVCGVVCGFPVGVKITADLYRSGAICKSSAERLMAFSNLPSPAFIISAVGLGMFGNKTVGLILLLSVIFSSVICGMIFKRNAQKSIKTDFISEQKFSVVESIKSSGVGTVSICAFVTAFSVLTGLMIEYIKYRPVLSVLVALAEVTCAADFFAAASFSTTCFTSGVGLYAMFGTAFSLGFGGLSVMLQSATFLGGLDLKLKKYFGLKIIQGVVCGTVALLLSVLFF